MTRTPANETYFEGAGSLTPEQLWQMPESQFLSLPSTYTDPALNRAYGERLASLSSAPGGTEGTARSGTEGETSVLRRAVATPATEIRREQVAFLDPGRVPFRMVTVLAGNPGLGKSQWSCGLAARVSRGDHGRPPATALLLTAEDSWSMTVRPRLEAAQADLDLVRFVSIATEDGDDGLTIPDDVAELDRLVAEYQADVVIVDPLVAHLPVGVDSHKDQSVRRALAPLHRIADTRGCAIVALVHLNKAQGLAPLQRLGGSVAFGAFARSVLLLDRDPDDPDGDEGSQRVLAHIKCNVGPFASSLLYQVAQILLPAADGHPETETSRLELLGESSHNGRELLASATGEERSAIDEAVAFLEAELGDGDRRPAADLQREARKIGITEPTLRRARKRLDVKTAKADFDGGWEWRIAKASEVVTPSDLDDTRRLQENPDVERDSASPEATENAEGVSPTCVTPSGDPRRRQCPNGHGEKLVNSTSTGYDYLACGCMIEEAA